MSSGLILCKNPWVLNKLQKPKSIRGWCIEVNLTLTKQVWEWLSMINVLLRVETERKRSCILVYAYTSIHFSQICEPGQAHCVDLTSLCDIQFFQSQSNQWRFNIYWLRRHKPFLTVIFLSLKGFRIFHIAKCATETDARLCEKTWTKVSSIFWSYFHKGVHIRKVSLRCFFNAYMY